MKNQSFSRKRERVRQQFSPMVDQYFVNKNGDLEKSPIQKDMQELIDSADYTKLDAIYDAMLDIHYSKLPINDDNDIVMEREGFEDDLSQMLRFDEIRDRYAVENPEVANMSHREVVDYLKGKVDTAEKAIKDKIKEKEDKKHEKTPHEKESEQA